MGTGDGYYTQNCNISREASEFQKELDADGQFVTGAFPSIYGGSMPSASKTALNIKCLVSGSSKLQTTGK